MARKNQRYDQQFKREAVQLYETSSKSVAEIEADLGISSGLLNKWRAQLRRDGEQAFPGSGHQTEAEAEVRRLKRELEIVRQERDILKKAIQVFSRPEP
jgi:transposase